MEDDYCGSNNVDSVAWYAGNSTHATHPVAQKLSNFFGFYDMNGNVWEWVEDRNQGNYNGAPTDGSVWQNNGERRMRRGSSWDYLANSLHSAIRDSDPPDARSSSIGFRVARTQP